ncbi:hypothetical protein [uncultured Massilia sp.]|uniref:hypothetical protein n=1 Tax=uncultured Massilia sp. TaxID=169973 RepID=UPI0025D8E3AF|nr:hypothetical protein [uncultured Massilia sp.]
MAERVPERDVRSAPRRIDAAAAGDGPRAGVPDLRGSVAIEGAGHWLPQERPREADAPILSFLRGPGGR